MCVPYDYEFSSEFSSGWEIALDKYGYDIFIVDVNIVVV